MTGIGFEAARRLAERGASVLVHGRAAEDAQAAAGELIAAAGIDVS